TDVRRVLLEDESPRRLHFERLRPDRADRGFRGGAGCQAFLPRRLDAPFRLDLEALARRRFRERGRQLGMEVDVRGLAGDELFDALPGAPLRELLDAKSDFESADRTVAGVHDRRPRDPIVFEPLPDA